MSKLVPTKVFLTKGVGQHKYQLKSFEEALRKAGVAQQNLVQVSSILPPQCKVISCESGLKKLVPGEICYCVMARADTNEGGRQIHASVGLAIPKEDTNWGYLSEVHGYGMNQQEAADMAEDLAAGMLGTTLGLEVEKGTGLYVQRSYHQDIQCDSDCPRPVGCLDDGSGDSYVPVRLTACGS